VDVSISCGVAHGNEVVSTDDARNPAHDCNDDGTNDALYYIPYISCRQRQRDKGGGVQAIPIERR
jgi:hypothetical protein